MKTDHILEVFIDKETRLCLRVEKEGFPYIYREAAGVNWNQEGRYLYSTPPLDWTYLDWYRHIYDLAYQYGCKLILSSNTKWTNIPNELKEDILAQSNNGGLYT